MSKTEGTVKRGEGAFARAAAIWKERVKPGTKMTCRELSEMAGVDPGLGGRTDRTRVSSFLSSALKSGWAGVAGQQDKVTLYERLPKDATKPDASLDVSPGKVMTPMPEERICFQCNKNFTAAEVGEGILALFQQISRMKENQRETIRTVTQDHRQAIEEIKNLKQLLDEKDNKIVELNKALAAGATGMDLHKLADFRNHLPDQAGGS
jgi:hypothetical protein